VIELHSPLCRHVCLGACHDRYRQTRIAAPIHFPGHGFTDSDLRNGVALRTPTDIFPNINIPVISVVFSYTGLSPDDMSGRIVTFYERSLTTTVNDIQHIESQSIPNYGIIKIFFQPTVNINAALAQVSAMSQTVLSPTRQARA